MDLEHLGAVAEVEYAPDPVGVALLCRDVADGYTDEQWQSIAEHLGENVQNGLT